MSPILTADRPACPSSRGGHRVSHDVSHVTSCCCKCFTQRNCRSCMGSDNISNYFVIQPPHHNMEKDMGEMVERCQVHCSAGAAFCTVQNQKRVLYWKETLIFISMPQERSHSLCCLVVLSVNPGWMLWEQLGVWPSSGLFCTWKTACCGESCSVILQIIKSSYDLRLRISDRMPWIFHC